MALRLRILRIILASVVLMSSIHFSFTSSLAQRGSNSAIHNLFLPLIDQAPPPRLPLFSVEIIRGSVERVSTALNTLKPDLVRYNGVNWSEIEPQHNTFDWSRLAGIDRELAMISASGADIMLIIRGTPSWAQQVPGKTCGAIAATELPEFAAFVGELVQRYSLPPYNVKYWEFGNEPDIDPSLVDSEAPYGCWGDASDPYYGGAQYAEMLATVYPVIKATNPEAQVVLGGLLLDCDPSTPPSGKDCLPAKFLEGILRSGGGEYFDIAAYHSYIYWADGDVDWDIRWPAWQHRGGALLGKLDFVRDTLAQYGYVKPVIMNEGGLLCYDSSPECEQKGFRQDQANYAVRMYTRSLANGLIGAVWYTLTGPGWQQGGLLDQNQQVLPAFRALNFIRTHLSGSTYIGAINTPGLEGYAFRRDSYIYKIYWSNSDNITELALPTGTTAVYNSEGATVQSSGATISIGFEPQIILYKP